MKMVLQNVYSPKVSFGDGSGFCSLGATGFLRSVEEKTKKKGKYCPAAVSRDNICFG